MVAWWICALLRGFGAVSKLDQREVPMSNQTESSSQKKTFRRRRRLIVDKPFQYRMIGLLVAIWAANSIFFSIVLYYFYEGHILRFYDLVPRGAVRPLMSAPVLFTTAIGFILVFGLVMIGIIGMYLSNQIAGPLYRVKLSLNRISEGDLNFEIHFRDRDFLRDFPGYFNNMLRGLKEQGVNDIEALKSIEQNITDAGRAKELLRELREKKEQLYGLASEKAEPEEEARQLSEAVH
jgi:methyl-accepting chemotaxis protein